MALAIIVRGPDKTEATLNDAQFKAAEAIIVKMMNQDLTVKKAERLITERCT